MSLQRNLTTTEIRNLLIGCESRRADPFTVLRERCASLEEDPTAYGFEFIEEDPDGHLAPASVRDIYYAWKMPPALLPEGFTSAVYILAPDDGAPEESCVVRFRALIVTADGEEIDSEYACDDWWDTCGQAVEWLNEQLGGPIIKRQPEQERTPR